MEWYPAVVLLVQCVTANSDVNQSPKYGLRQDRSPRPAREFIGFQQRSSERSKRFIAFNNDESNIRLEIEFSVPFLEIPLGIKGSHGSSEGGLQPMLSINAKSAVVATTLFFATYLLVPTLVRYFLPKGRQHHRDRGSEESELERMVRRVESTLHVNSTACWQQRVCSLVRDSRDNASTPGLGKVLDGLSSMSWVENLTKGSALDEAFIQAKKDVLGCQVFYSRCVLDSRNPKSFPSELARSYMN